MQHTLFWMSIKARVSRPSLVRPTREQVVVHRGPGNLEARLGFPFDSPDSDTTDVRGSKRNIKSDLRERGSVESRPQFGLPWGLFLANLTSLTFSTWSGDQEL